LPLRLKDLPHFWGMYETCTSDAVANLCRKKLLELYHCTDNLIFDHEHFRAAFIG
jgi:hypothetical protein